MSTARFKVEKRFCEECSLALRRFIGGMDGVSDVHVESGDVVIDFDERTIPEERVRSLARDSIERLGYRIDGD
jgi:copper chaperone CopZ